MLERCVLASGQVRALQLQLHPACTLLACFARLKLKDDELLSNVAFNCNLRHYNKVHRLTEQYRMHPHICAAVSRLFYQVGQCRLTPG